MVTINTKRISNGSVTSVGIVDTFNECTDAPTKPFRSGLRVLQHERFPNESFVRAWLCQWSEKARKRESNINRQISIGAINVVLVLSPRCMIFLWFFIKHEIIIKLATNESFRCVNQFCQMPDDLVCRLVKERSMYSDNWNKKKIYVLASDITI